MSLLYSELEFLKSLWVIGTEEEYIGWRNSFLGIDSGAPYTYKNTGWFLVIQVISSYLSPFGLFVLPINLSRCEVHLSFISDVCTFSLILYFFVNVPLIICGDFTVNGNHKSAV